MCYHTKSLRLTWRIWPIKEKKFMDSNAKNGFLRTYVVLDDSSTHNSIFFFFVKSQDLWYHICAKVFISIGSFSQKFCFRQACKLPTEECLLSFDGLVTNLSKVKELLTSDRMYNIINDKYRRKCFWYNTHCV